MVLERKESFGRGARPPSAPDVKGACVRGLRTFDERGHQRRRGSGPALTESRGTTSISLRRPPLPDAGRVPSSCTPPSVRASRGHPASPFADIAALLQRAATRTTCSMSHPCELRSWVARDFAGKLDAISSRRRRAAFTRRGPYLLEWR